LSSIQDGRYKEQSFRLQNSSGIPCHQIIYIIEGFFNGHSSKEKQLIYSAMVSLNQFKGFSIIRSQSVLETVEIIFNMADKMEREFKKGQQLYLAPTTTTTTATPEYSEVVKCVKKDNITKENIGIIMLSQIPGISSTIAKALLLNFTSFFHFLECLKKDPSFLNSIVVNNRKLNKSVAQKLIDFFE
jgi:ERCC4-type nuclease